MKKPIYLINNEVRWFHWVECFMKVLQGFLETEFAYWVQNILICFSPRRPLPPPQAYLIANQSICIQSMTITTMKWYRNVLLLGTYRFSNMYRSENFNSLVKVLRKQKKTHNAGSLFPIFINWFRRTDNYCIQKFRERKFLHLGTPLYKVYLLMLPFNPSLHCTFYWNVKCFFCVDSLWLFNFF